MFKILLIGDSCEDVYHYGHCGRLSPEAPVPVLKHHSTETREGMCLNVRNNLVAFNLEVCVLTNNKMIRKERFIDLKTKQHLLRTDFGESSKLEPLTELQLNKNDFSGLDAVIISDYDKGFLTNKNIKFIISKAKNVKVPVFVDSKKSDLSEFENCILKINKLENSKVKEFPNNYELVVTHGKNGAMWNNKLFPTKACDVFDVCGAGDTFLAALASEYLKTKSFEKSIIFANRCSKIAVQKFGTYVLTKRDINDLRV